MLPLIPVALQLAQFAPALMRFFGAGEASAGVAEKIVGIAQSITGTPTPEAALEAMKANTEFQRAFAMRTLEIDAQLEQLFLADKQNARGHDVEVRRLNDGRNVRADVMLLMAFASVIAISAILAFSNIDGNTAIGGFLIAIGGMFARNIGTAFDFEFGSSRSSRTKDDNSADVMQTILAQMRPPLAPTPIAGVATVLQPAGPALTASATMGLAPAPIVDRSSVAQP